MDIALPALTPGSLVPALNPTLVTNGAGLDKIKNYFSRIAEKPSPEFAADYETNFTKTFYDRRARTLQLGDKNEQYIIDFLHFAQSTEALIAGQGNFHCSSWAKPIVDVLEPAFNSDAFLKIGQRLDFEYQVSKWSFGMPLWNVYSIDIAERIIWAGLHTFKDVVFYSLAAQAARYFKVQIDKTEQKLFDLETELTESQIAYACLDLRLPIAIRAMQLPILRRDNLERITAIENESSVFFSDIHLNGWNIDLGAWQDLIVEWSQGYHEAIKHLDTYFVPVVGSKSIGDIDLDAIEQEWKLQTVDSEEEIRLKEQLKLTKDKDAKDAIRAQIVEKSVARKASAAEARKRYMAVRSKITASKKNFDTYEGEAAINYSSNAQLLKAMREMKGFNATNLPNTDDTTLKKLKHKDVVKHLRDYRTYSKMLETYGEQWTSEFSGNPSADEGWINPGTKKIHSTINQLEAETGRTSSVKPNIQNLPHDDRVRACFVADPPDEDIHVCKVCDELTLLVTGADGVSSSYCPSCEKECQTKAEEYVIVTCDMSGAELRIIAEESNSQQWTTALNNDWDLHSCGTETLYPEEWPAATCTPGEIVIKDGKEVALPPCAYFNKQFYEKLGKELDHQKCKCPKHMELRDRNKAANFLLAYGGGPDALAAALDKTSDDAKVLMQLHEAANPEVWAYLEESGKQAVRDMESRSRCGRRRLFSRPDWDAARIQARERMFESLKSKGKLTLGNGEKLKLEDMHPERWQISSALKGMFSSIERRGKNHKIQSLNATIAKRAFGAGFDADGKPYLWHQLASIKGKVKNFVHDEVVLQVPKRFGEKALAIVKDCIRRAGAEFLTKVVMDSEGRISYRWQK